MTDFIFRILAPSVEISGRTERFAVRRIFCVGRNYAEHAREFGNDERDPPFFFTKPADCLLYTSPSPRDGLLSRMPSSA